MRTSQSISGLAVGVSLLLAPTLVADAQSVKLNPGYIEGTVQVGTATISLLRMTAISDLFIAEETTNPNVTSAPYDLTVQVEEGSSRIYRVRAQIYTDGSQDRMYVPEREVTVVDADPPVPSTLDFIFDPPGYIDGTVAVAGANISYVVILAQQAVSPFSLFGSTTQFAVGGPQSVDYSFPVVPGESLNCYGYAYLTNGVRITLEPQTVTPTVSGPARCDYTIDAGNTGSIAGVLDFDGPELVHQYHVSVQGPTSGSFVFVPPYAGPGGPNSHDYSVAPLTPGTYTVGLTQAFLNNYDDEFRFPRAAFSPSKFGLVIAPGLVTGLDIQACQAFINGTFQFTGIASLDDLSYGQARARGDPAVGSPTQDGFSFDRITPGTGTFDLIVSGGGAWVNDFFRIDLFRPAGVPEGFLNERIFLNVEQYPFGPDSLIDLFCGETAVRDYSIPTGSLIVDFQVADGGVLTNPELRFGTCESRDEITNELLYRYTFDAFSAGQIDVLNGTAVFEGPAATCNNIRARATVNGTLTTFAEINDVEILPEVITRPDIIPPTLSVTSPAPDTCIDATEVTVVGTATDNRDIASVTVNGITADLTPVTDPDGLAAVTFEATVPLPDTGPNAIVIVAADGAGNTDTENLTLVNDGRAPTVDFTPLDGTLTDLLDINVEGLASDDVGIESIVIIVNGEQIAEFSGGGALEVAFSQPVTLQPGPNTIAVVATDGCGKSTTATHGVTAGSPPVAQDVPVTTNEDTPVGVALNATDPDGDALTYTIVTTPLHGTISGAAPNLTYSPDLNYFGPDSFTYKANDGTFDSNIATVSITVYPVNDAPVAVAGGDIVQACTGAEGALVVLDASGSSDVENDLLTFTWTGPFLEGGGVVTGEIVSVTLPVGVSTVTLTVADGTDQATDSLNVTVTVQVSGLLPPLADLVHVGEDPPMPMHAFKQGRTLPLRLRLFCGATELTDTEVTPPKIASIRAIGGAPVDLDVIDPDAGAANDNGVLFRYSAPNWVHNLNTQDIAAGMTYIVTIEMPDGEHYDAKFVLK